MSLDSMFKKQCEENGIEHEEFPYSFPTGVMVNHVEIIEAMMWILKKRQDKILAEAIV